LLIYFEISDQYNEAHLEMIQPSFIAKEDTHLFELSKFHYSD